MTGPADPLRLPCGLVLANRIEKSATSELLATAHGLPTPAHEALYARWARGGAGLLVTGNVMVDGDHRAAAGDVVLEAETPLEPLRRWVRAVKGAAPGAHLFVQLGHPGRQAPRSVDAKPVAPSPVPLRGPRLVFAPPRELSSAEVDRIVDRFAVAAARAEEAGASGVELHAGHGYLLHQFSSPRTNLRTDAWGGSPAGRRRLLLAVLAATRARVGAGFAVAVKLNVPEEADPSAEREAVDTVRALAAEGADFVELTGGTFESDPVVSRRAHGAASSGGTEAFFAGFAERLRKTTTLPIALTGGFVSGAGVRKVLRDGVADLVGLARTLIVEPDFPKKILGDEPALRVSRPRALTLPGLPAAARLVWYETQLRRLAEGKGPERSVSPARAMVGAVRRFVI